MKKSLAILHFGLSVVLLLDLLIEYFFARPAVFHASVYQIRLTTSELAQYGSIVLLIAAVLGRTGRRTFVVSALLVVLLFLEPILTTMGASIALHAIVGFVSLIVNVFIIFLGTIRFRRRNA